ncbi:MAG TPA: thiamine pyrophosphate-dependent enzyme, partial [Gammaproteobacteria bacterium]|nr:thiamine pyrophosphate-dependent enzyme [Gammaproteobacteria bacterium]
RPELRASEQTPVTPQRWRRDLNEVLPADAIVFSDIGGHMLFNIHNLRFGRDQQFFINLSFACMGHGTVAPIGAKLAVGDRPVFGIVGDACFTMNGMELLVAVEYDVPVIWIIENNQMHGVTWHATAKARGAPMDSIVYKKPLQIDKLASAMGLELFVVEGPGQMQAAVTEALARNRPTVIEVRVDPSIGPPLEDRAELIGGFSRE